MRKLFLLELLVVSIMLNPAFAKTRTDLVGGSANYDQNISIVNILGNTNLPDPGMTPSSLLIKYFNGGTFPCWTATVDYHDEYIVHAGPGLGCVAKINQIVVMPLRVADRLMVYQGQ